MRKKQRRQAAVSPPIEIFPMVAQNVFNNDDAMQELQRLWDDLDCHDPDPSTLRLPPFWYLDPDPEGILD